MRFIQQETFNDYDFIQVYDVLLFMANYFTPLKYKMAKLYNVIDELLII